MGVVSRFFLLVVSIGIMAGASARGQSAYDLFGSARADALGHSTTASTSALGVHANPASPATAEAPTVVFYAREGFGLDALRYGASHVTVPFDWGVLSTGASTFGFEDYREVHLSAGYARGVQLGTARLIHLGVTARYYHTAISGYGSAGALTANAGITVRLLRSLRFGVHATNLHGSPLVPGEPLPRTLAAGLNYRVLEQLRLLIDVFKDIRFPLAVRSGMEVRPVAPLALRAGLTTAPVRFMGGAGFRLGPIQADVAMEQHQVLGWSPSASLEIQW